MLFLGKDICLFCKENQSISYNYICKSCMELLEIVNEEENFKLPHMEKVYYSLVYNKFTRENLHSFKFQGKSYLYKPFGEILLRTIEDLQLNHKMDYIIFVPSHRRKKAMRGYNQGELLAGYVSEKLDIPLLKKHLIKTKTTKDQNTLGKTERRKNLKDCFKTDYVEDFKDKEILLIDDIITTGSTMEECSQVLIENGAGKIYGLTLTSSQKL